jgi:transmembrane sensor
MNQEKFWVLFSKKMADEATLEELDELAELTRQHPEWQYAIQNLEDIWKHQSPNDFSEEEDAYMLHLHRMKELKVPFEETPDETPMRQSYPGKKWYWIAAAVAIGLIGFFVFRGVITPETDPQESIASNEITTRMGSRSKVQLPDGSVVWLNAGSKLIYDKNFGRQVREVTLQGEAFFDVVKQTSKPFIIHASNINIKVLGTSFNVKAYPDDAKVETSLIRGSIEITIKNRPDNKIILSPNEKLIVKNETAEKLLSKQGPAQPAIAFEKLHYNTNDSTLAETEWVADRLTVREETFEELVVKMERWYDVNIELKNERLNNRILSVTFEDETVDQALEALKELFQFRYEKTGNNIIIHR